MNHFVNLGDSSRPLHPGERLLVHVLLVLLVLPLIVVTALVDAALLRVACGNLVEQNKCCNKTWWFICTNS